MKKLMLILAVFFMLAGMVSATPYFSISSMDDWETPVASGQIRPMSPVQWDDYMGQWQAHFAPDDGEPYPTDTQFMVPELYVADVPNEPEDAGLVMAWGNENLPDGNYTAAWIYEYPLDPDLSNCTITLTVMPPQFSTVSGSQINNVSFGMKDMNGNIRSWHWTCGPTGALPWNVTTTITINTALTGVGAATPPATGYVNNPAFDITKVLSFIVDENAQWVNGAVSVPPPGQLLQRPWNLWADLMVTRNSTNPIIAGINIDVHQDIDPTGQTVPNDFHVEGRIESGVPLGMPGGGGWSNPPVLVQHIDGTVPYVFPNFNITITPDTTDPGQNWYKITADWSGLDIPYCNVIHLGLEFEVTCHNIIIELVGWWTKDGVRINAGANQGYVPVLGFDVHDNIGDPANQGPQYIRIQNGGPDSAHPVEGAIPVHVVRMDLIKIKADEMEQLLGENPFAQLRPGGLQEALPWIPVPVAQLPSGDFAVDSFFDITYEIDVDPGLKLAAGDFLLARELIEFENNAGQTEQRWIFEIHEAHEEVFDLGDAPDSTNSHNMQMWTYPSGTLASFPTVYQMGSPPHGPIHYQPQADAFLGQTVTGEHEADTGFDMDPTNNIIPPNNAADLDWADDGLLGLPLKMPNCKQTQFQYIVTNNIAGSAKYFNAWADFNRDGDWDDVHTCTLSDGTTVNVPEYIVVDQDLSTLPVGVNTVTSPLFYSWHQTNAAGTIEPIWVRLTLAESKWVGSGSGGSGPATGNQYGETEDYYFVPVVPPACGCADLTGDGFVDISDFACLAAKWLQTCP